MKPGSCARPFFGVEPQVVKRDGTPCAPNEGGFLVIKKPWPSMLRGIHGDPERYDKQYWSEIKGVYFVREFGDSESLTRKTFTTRPRSEGLWVRLRF